MYAHASAEFRLDLTIKQGTVLRAHLLKHWKSSRRRPAALNTPPLPEALAYLMGWFDELSAGRQYDFGSPLPLAWGDLAAWSQVLARRAAPWQMQALRRLDDLWRDAWIKGREKTKDNPQPGAGRKPPARRRVAAA